MLVPESKKDDLGTSPIAKKLLNFFSAQAFFFVVFVWSGKKGGIAASFFLFRKMLNNRQHFCCLFLLSSLFLKKNLEEGKIVFLWLRSISCFFQLFVRFAPISSCWKINLTTEIPVAVVNVVIIVAGVIFPKYPAVPVQQLDHRKISPDACVRRIPWRRRRRRQSLAGNLHSCFYDKLPR